jgi:sugar fermentation stimulation protein A
VEGPFGRAGEASPPGFILGNGPGLDRYNPDVRIEQPLIHGRLVRRYKRFLADVELPNGEVVVAHCPNTGTLLGCLPEGAPAVLRDSQNPERKLRFTWQTVEVDGTWVNVDTSLPNGVVAEAVSAGQVPELAGYDGLRREVKYGVNSRIDLLLEREGERCYVEVKSTTLAVDGQARFPDAVTVRGRKHLDELARQVEAGDRAVIFFLVSRSDVQSFAPADDIDPQYGVSLRAAVKAGVEAMAWATEVTPGAIELTRALPIEL